MTTREFIDWVQGYYSPYPVGQKRDIAEYVTRLSPEYLDALKQVLVRRCSSEYRRPPDVAVFERLSEEVEEAVAMSHPQTLIEAPRDLEEYRNLADLTDEAHRRGIDPARPGWMSKLLMARVREQREKKEAVAV